MRARSSWTQRRLLLSQLADEESYMDLANAQTELTVKARAQEALDRVMNVAGVRPTGKSSECRWYTANGFTVIESLVSGCLYVIEDGSGCFFRINPESSSRMVASSPRDVIAKDRAWLFALFSHLHCGAVVLRRFTPGGTHKEDSKMPPIETKSQSPPRTLEPSLVGISVKASEKKIVLTETSKSVELRPDQVVAMARLAGVAAPDKAQVSITANGYVRIAWTETKESVEE